MWGDSDSEIQVETSIQQESFDICVEFLRDESGDDKMFTPKFTFDDYVKHMKVCRKCDCSICHKYNVDYYGCNKCSPCKCTCFAVSAPCICNVVCFMYTCNNCKDIVIE